MGRKWGQTPLLLLAAGSATLLALGGCVVETTVDRYVKVPESRVDSAYVKPDADFSRYRKLQAAPLEIYYYEGQGAPDPQDLARLKQIFRDAFLTAIGDDYLIVDQAGPDVLGVRASLVDLETSRTSAICRSAAAPPRSWRPGA